MALNEFQEEQVQDQEPPAQQPPAIKLYKTLIGDGYTPAELGSEQDFVNKIKDSARASKLYDVLINDGYSEKEIRTKNEFLNAFVEKKKIGAEPSPSLATGSPYVGTLPPGTPPTPKLTDKEKIELDKALMADAERAIAATQKPAKYIDYTAPPEVQARQKQIIEKELKTKPVGAPEKEKQGDVLNSIAALDRGFYKNLIGNPIKGLGTLLQLGGSKLEGISEKLGFITKEQRAYGKEPISQSLIDFGDWFNKTIDELAPQDEEFKGTLKDQFAQAFGQVGSLILTGGASAAAKGATATTATKAAQQIAGQIAPRGGLKEAAKAFTSDLASPVAVSSGLSMGQAEFDRAKEAGATDEQAFEAFWKNAAVGSVLERIPVMQFFKRFNNATQGGVANYIKTKGVAGLTGGIEEMTTEVLQQLYSNKTAQDIYNINQNLYEGIGESGGIGFGVGFLLNALGANAKILRKQGKIDEAKTVEAQIEQFKQKAEKGGESSYSWNGIPQQPDVIEKMIDNMTADELIKANIQIQNDPRLQSKLQVKISVSPIKEQVRQANPDLSEEALDKLTDLEIRLKNLENNTTQAAKDRVAEIKNEIKNITSGKKIIAGKFIGEFPGKPVEKLTIGESLDKSANYKGQQGTIVVDGPIVIFKVDDTGEEFELGRIDEVADKPLSDFELSTEVLEKAPPKKEENYRGYTIKDVSTETGEAGFFVIDADGDSLGEVFASPEEAKKVINAIEPQMERQKIKPKVEAVEKEVVEVTAEEVKPKEIKQYEGIVKESTISEEELRDILVANKEYFDLIKNMQLGVKSVKFGMEDGIRYMDTFDKDGNLAQRYYVYADNKLSIKKPKSAQELRPAAAKEPEAKKIAAKEEEYTIVENDEGGFVILDKEGYDATGEAFDTYEEAKRVAEASKFEPEEKPKEITLYHGGRMDSKGDIFLTPDKNIAKEYASINKGDVIKISIDENKVINEDKVREIINSLNLTNKEGETNFDDLLLHELLDPRFESSLEAKDIKKVKEIIKNKGYNAISYIDEDITGKSKTGTQSYLLLEKPKESIESKKEEKEGEAITLNLADKGKAEGVKIAIPGFENMDLVAVREGFNYNIYEATTGMQVAATSAFDLESAKSQIRDALLRKNVSAEKIFEAIIKGKIKQINESPAFTQYKAIKEEQLSKKPYKYTEEERAKLLELATEARAMNENSYARAMEIAANAREDAKYALNVEDAKKLIQNAKKNAEIENIKKQNKPLPEKEKRILDDSEQQFKKIINSQYEKDKYSTIPEEIRKKAYEAYKKMIAIHNKYGYYPKSIVEGFPAIGKSPAPDIALAWYIKAVNAKKIETRPARIKEAVEKLNQSVAKLDDIYNQEIGEAKPKESKINENAINKTGEELLELLNEGRKAKDVYEISGASQEGDYIVIEATNKKGEKVYNVLDTEGNVPPDMGPNWRNLQSVIDDIEPKERIKTLEKSAQETIREEYASWEDGKATIKDLVDLAEQQEIDELKRAVKEYRNQEADFEEFGGRIDMEDVEQNFIDALERYLAKAEEKPEESASISITEEYLRSLNSEQLDDLIKQLEEKYTEILYSPEVGMEKKITGREIIGKIIDIQQETLGDEVAEKLANKEPLNSKEKTYYTNNKKSVDAKVEEIKSIKKPSKSELPLDQKGREVGNIEYKKGTDHVTGRTITRTAPNGTKIKGTFKLVPAVQLVPSHNPITFTKNEAFPQTKDGKTINDRDYEADKPAQEQVVNIAQNLDGTAVTQMPTVSKEGIVYDGNNRTMSRQRAAKNMTDGEYLNALKEQAEMYGFTEEQVSQMKNPTLVFEVEENLPFDTNTMAVFNVAEKKAQSPVQRAVAISKRISDKAKRLLAGLYDQVETPSEVTSSPKMMKQAMDILVDEGLIQTLELPRFIDKGVATPDGISLLEGIVMAASLNESAITALSLEGMGNVKKMIIKNVVGLMQNSAKGENSLIAEIGKAIDIVQKASASKMSVLDYLSQYDVFSTKDYTLEEMCMALLLDTNKPSELKKFLSSYNSEVGIPSLLGEDVSKQALLDRKLNTLISSYEKIKKNLEGVAVKRAEPAKPSPEQAEQPPAKPIAEAPQKPAAEKSALEKAKEERKAAKDKLNNIRKRLGITPDPKEEARALFEYHKALVKEAKEYVKLGIKTVEDWAKEIGEKVNVALKTAWDEATGKISAIKKPEDLGYTPKELDDYRGIRIKDNEERRQELGMAPRETNPESFEKWDNEAERLLANGYNIEGLIAKMERGEATTPVENSIRKIFAATLDAELESNPTPENQALARRFVQASDVASRQAGLQLVSLKSNAEPLSTFTDFIVAKMEANAVDILTNEEIEAVKKQFEKVKAEKEKYQKLYNEAQNVIAKREAQKELNKAKKQIIKEGKRDYEAERQALKERLKKQFNDYIESTKKLGIASDGGAEGFAITVEMAKTIMEIVKSHTEEIGANLADVTKRTVADIKDIFTDIKEQDVIDVIAGKYADKKPPLSELQANLKDLRAEAKLLAELDRVMSGKPRDEREQRQKNQRLFQLKAEIDKIKREKGLDQYSTEEKVKRLIQQNLKREQEIKDKIARKEFDTERKPLSPYDDAEFKKSNPELYKKLLDSYNRKNDARHEFELELLKDEQAKATKIQKILRVGEKIANTTKKAVTGIDDSFLFMQTLVAITRRPALGTKAFVAHIRDFASKKAYERSLAEIHNSELYPLMVQSGLDITEPKTLTQKAREEAYSGDTFDFYITIKGKEHKVLGSLFEPFERAATSLGNNMRVLSFAKISNKLMQEGYTFTNNPEVFKDLARMLNTETGRGKLNESVEKASKLVTAGIWSPRLMASRMDLIGLTDALSFVVPGTSGYYRNMSPEIRKEAVRTAAQFSITILALSYVIAYGFGGDLDDDPTSQGFMDIKIGNKSYNLAGGFSQYIRLIAQTLKGGKTMDGRFVEFKGNKDRGSNVLHFTRGKLTPIGGVVADVFSGMKDFTGKPITVESELKRLWIPLSLQNVTKDVERDGTEALFSGTLPSFVGIGVKDVRDFNIKADLYTVDEEKKNQTLRFIINKGLEIPRLGYKNSIKIRIDENHPEGVMNDEEYQRLKDKVSDKLLVEINAILDKTYTIKEYDEIEEKEIDIEEGVSGEDLPAEQLKTKIESAKEKAVSEALEELGLKRPKRKPTAIEEKSEEEE